MIKEGDMVRHSGSPPMLVRHIFMGMAHCQLVDQHGRVINRFAYVRDLDPLWLSIGPKSVWPEPDRIIITEDEDEAPARTIVPSAASRRKAMKPKRSKKLKRAPKKITAKLFDELVAA